LPTVAVGQSRLTPCPSDTAMNWWDACQGTRPFPDGLKYVGQFKDGKGSGQGTLMWPSQRLRIRSLKVANKVVEDVLVSVAPVNGDILLGQSFLSKFKSRSVDNERHLLILR
jgi:hypothetical protein